ncbi:MAG TPA: hypothetical protein VFG69_12010 [Nannocystaceae bacterium]|nr:hypothetical protein [Nannocystaceae bacterium]
MRFRLVSVAPILWVMSGCSDDPDNATSFGNDESSTGDGTNTTNTTPTTAESTGDDTTGAPTTDPDTSSAGPSSEDGGGAVCGNGEVEGNEDCDCGGLGCSAEDLGNTTCLDVVDPKLPGAITGGILGCNPASCRFDTSMCTYCGDREINGNEACEPDEDIPSTCASLGAGVAGPVVCDAACQIDTSGCTDCAFNFEFEAGSCPDGFSAAPLVVGAGASSWACGEPTVYALGPGANFPSSFGTNLSGPYNANEISALTSSVIDTSDACPDAGLEMTIRHWHNFEGGDPLNGDGGIVQVSDNGVDWTTIAPIDGDPYGSELMIDATYPPVDGVYGFDATADENQVSNSTFDLSEFVGSDSLQVRFVFGSNASVQLGGWYIDYVHILGTGTK